MNSQLIACWVNFHACVVFVSFLSKLTSSGQFNTIRVSKRLDPDQDRHSVGPDLVPNCLQRLSAGDTTFLLARKDLIELILQKFY